jgi:hypothetical protein
MSPAVDQNGDGDLGELVARAGEHLRAPDRAELADGKDLAIGRPFLRGPPVTTRRECLTRWILARLTRWILARLTRWILTRLGRWILLGPEPGLAGLRLKPGPRFGPRLSCHSVVHPPATPRVSCGI